MNDKVNRIGYAFLILVHYMLLANLAFLHKSKLDGFEGIYLNYVDTWKIIQNIKALR